MLLFHFAFLVAVVRMVRNSNDKQMEALPLHTSIFVCEFPFCMAYQKKQMCSMQNTIRK